MCGFGTRQIGMTKMTKPAIYPTEKFQTAMAYATEQRKDQSRKSTTITYICHPFGVASSVQPPWKERKEVHINHLHDADLETLTVTATDKAHNARSIATDLQNQGPELWKRFNANREDIICYNESVFTVLQERKRSPALLTPLHNAIDVMRAADGS